MDTEKAKIFLTVMEEGSLSGAAEKLGYTTSGISRAIASIEEETGVTLFVRGKKGVKLTEDAELFLPVMRELVHQEEKMKETSDRLKGIDKGTVTIGISYGGYFKLISDKLKVFADKYPGIKIKTLQATSTELLKALEDHEADLAIMTYRESNLNFFELRADPMVACLPAGHPFTKKKFFPLEQFEKEAYIAPYPGMDTDYNRVFESFGITPDIQYTTMDIYAAYCMVEAGLGVSLLNRLEIESWSGRVSVMRTSPEKVLKIGVMYPETGGMTFAARRLLSDIIGENSQNAQ